MHCLYANAIVQPSVQHYSCYMAWKTKDHTWCRYCHLCIIAPMSRCEEKKDGCKELLTLPRMIICTMQWADGVVPCTFLICNAPDFIGMDQFDKVFTPPSWFTPSGVEWRNLFIGGEREKLSDQVVFELGTPHDRAEAPATPTPHSLVNKMDLDQVPSLWQNKPVVLTGDVENSDSRGVGRDTLQVCRLQQCTVCSLNFKLAVTMSAIL